jgi:hypothetical protein
MTGDQNTFQNADLPFGRSVHFRDAPRFDAFLRGEVFDDSGFSPLDRGWLTDGKFVCDGFRHRRWRGREMRRGDGMRLMNGQTAQRHDGAMKLATGQLHSLKFHRQAIVNQVGEGIGLDNGERRRFFDRGREFEDQGLAVGDGNDPGEQDA